MNELSRVKNPVLLIGSTGVIGSRVARHLRRLHPGLPLAIVGRALSDAQALAKELKNATAVSVDLTKPDLGIPAEQLYSAVAIFMKDDSLHSLMFAQERRIPYMDISSAAFEIGPEVARFIHNPSASAVLMNSNWLAGTSTLATLYFARDFNSIDSITISALLDADDIGGKAADADYERQTGAVTSALVLQAGRWHWLTSEQSGGAFSASDGTQYQSQAFSNLDVLSLASSTSTQNVRFEFAVGDTPAKRQGEHFSHEIIITITGQRKDGRRGTFRYEIIHPEGQAPMTSLSAAVAIEALLGHGAKAPAPGLYMPSSLIDPDHAIARLRDIGTFINESPGYL